TGSVGRTIASFDDGLSWEADRADAAGVICTVTRRDDDPDAYCFEGDRVARGVAFLDAHFFTTHAWAREAGRTNAVHRSDDARDWDVVLEPGGFGGIAAGNGAVVLAGPSGTTYMMRSTDLGATWDRVDNGYGTWTNWRRAWFTPAHGGLFVFAADGNGFDAAHRVAYSADGAGWSLPTSMPDACPTNLRYFGGLGTIGDRIVLVAPSGAVCRSDDGARTWRVGASIPTVRSHDVVSTGDAIHAWTSDQVLTTEDGETWTARPLSPRGVSIGPVAYSPDTRTFVAVTSGYLNGYDRQRFYRSADGATWEELPADRYVASHPIVSIAYGRIDAP
ncbi:MAG: hypothetical protein M3Y87_34640, partial [Myxococcota bacterium]|nr:hypothetical protein [Myxococcota bacterium]